MGDTTLRYVPGIGLENLHELQEPGTCVIRRCASPDCATHWRLWFTVRAEGGPDAGTIVLLCVGLNTNGGYLELGDSKRWGFTRVGPGQWQVSPSIDVLVPAPPPDPANPNAAPPPRQSIWHHTPLVVDVPEPAPWA